MNGNVNSKNQISSENRISGVINIALLFLTIAVLFIVIYKTLLYKYYYAHSNFLKPIEEDFRNYNDFSDYIHSYNYNSNQHAFAPQFSNYDRASNPTPAGYNSNIPINIYFPKRSKILLRQDRSLNWMCPRPWLQCSGPDNIRLNYKQA